jgi:pimeloyl-ACP methyl ester carboxylesterase
MQTDGLVSNIESTTNFLRACFAVQPAPEDFQRMLAFNMVVPPQIRKMAIARSVNPGDMLPKIDVPVLLTHGTEDGLLLPSMSRYAATKIPNARLSIYEGIGHSPFYEDAPRYNAELADFVTSSGAG